MRQISTNFRQRIADYFEFYAIFVACVLLIILKLLHVPVDDQWVSAAILFVLFSLAIASHRDRSRDKKVLDEIATIALQVGDDSATRQYTSRSEATPDMLTDMRRFAHLAFVGISHPNLARYLREALAQTEPLPWETIDVFFASPDLGEIYEGRNYGGRLINARQEIAGVLTDPAYKDVLPRFRSVRFYQQKCFLAHTGSLLGASRKDISIIYAVHSAWRRHGDSHQGLTNRLAAHPAASVADSHFDHYNAIYRMLPQESTFLGEFERSLWDRSVNQWSEYAKFSTALPRSAEILAEIMSGLEGDSLLDVGSGCGESISVILNRCPNLTAVLLDGSPQMVRRLRDKFKQHSRVRCVLCALPKTAASDIDLTHDAVADKGFSFVVLHQCLSELSRSFASLEDLALWCRDRLKPDGRVLLCAHNTTVETPKPSGFEDWSDEFRLEVRKRLKNQHTLSPRRDDFRSVPQASVVSAFLSQGFTIEKTCMQEIPFTFEERRLLWQVPAVAATLVRESDLDNGVAARLINEALDATKNKTVLPRTVIVWAFTLSSGEAIRAGGTIGDGGTS